ncbi:MAG TPA: flagellar hook-basal body complex protein FliE [Hyphomicrobium sp.]
MSLSIAMLSRDIGGAVATGAPAISPPASAAAAPQADFGQTLASMAADAISTIKAGETTATAGMKGQASLQQVVQAVMQAEQTLQTVVAVRDKVVSAYQEISRMSI